MLNVEQVLNSLLMFANPLGIELFIWCMVWVSVIVVVIRGCERLRVMERIGSV